MDICIVFNDGINEGSMNLLKTEIETALAQNPTRIKLWFTTNGGEIHAALDFYDWITSNNFPIDIIGFNKIKSSGLIVFLAFESRFFKNKAEFLFHQVYIDEAKRSATTSDEKMKEFNDRMFEVIKSTINLPDIVYSTLLTYHIDVIIKDVTELQDFGIGSLTADVINIPVVIESGTVMRPR